MPFMRINSLLRFVIGCCKQIQYVLNPGLGEGFQRSEVVTCAHLTYVTCPVAWIGSLRSTGGMDPLVSVLSDSVTC